LSRIQAEYVTEVIMQVTSEILKGAKQEYASMSQMRELLQTFEVRQDKWKADLLKHQDMNNQSLSRDVSSVEHDMKSIRSDMKYEQEKQAGAYKLDLNLERGRVREDLKKMEEAFRAQEQRTDREMNNQRSLIETHKNDLEKWKSDLIRQQEIAMAMVKQDVAALQNEVKGIRTDLKYELQRLQGDFKLDLNLERGRLQTELKKMDDNFKVQDARIDREIAAQKTTIEANKNDLFKYFASSSIAFLGLIAAAARLLM